jgi:hypothetical protein
MSREGLINARAAPAPEKSGSAMNYASGAASIFMIGCGIASIVLFIYSTINTSNLIGDTENWRSIKPQITKIWWNTGIGAFILFFAMFIYVLQESAHTLVFILLISCISLALSFSAISMAAISTSGATPSG